MALGKMCLVQVAWESLAGAVLAWHLREGGLTAESLQRFNAERGPRVREVLTKVRTTHSYLNTSAQWLLFCLM